jgi:uncharacterized protein (UPF0262 family)
MPDDNAKHRLVAVTLDEDSIGRGNPDQEHERAIAIYDIVEANSFAIPGHEAGPYAVRLASSTRSSRSRSARPTDGR